MQPKTKHAGGCFLMVAILLGFLGGMSICDPLLGTLVGTAIGAAVAIFIWLLDRRRA